METIINLANANLPAWAVIIIAIASSFVGAFFGQWAKWNFEQKRLLRAERIKKIENWREMISDVSQQIRQGAFDRNVGGIIEALQSHRAFQSFRQHISDETRRRAMSPRSVMVTNAGSWLDLHLNMIASDIDRLEAEWDLK